MRFFAGEWFPVRGFVTLLFLFQVKFKWSWLDLTWWLSHVYVSSYFLEHRCFGFNLQGRLVSCVQPVKQPCLWGALYVCDGWGFWAVIVIAIHLHFFWNTVKNHSKSTGESTQRKEHWSEGFCLKADNLKIIRANLLFIPHCQVSIKQKHKGLREWGISDRSLLNLTATFLPHKGNWVHVGNEA